MKTEETTQNIKKYSFKKSIELLRKISIDPKIDELLKKEIIDFIDNSKSDQILNIETKLPTINSKLSINKKTGKFFASQEYKNFKNIIYMFLKRIKVKKPYALYIEIETHIDIDNPIKPVLDAIEQSGIIDNDKYVERLYIDKKTIKRNEQNRIKINIGTAL